MLHHFLENEPPHCACIKLIQSSTLKVCVQRPWVCLESWLLCTLGTLKDV